MAAYYNEIDPFAAAWLRELIKAGLIADGDVDTRSIEDVAPVDLRGYTQCHFFAGIGGWSYALRLAGWPDNRPVWTGSCPCQPFSEAGKGGGFDDERHLWPAWYWLIGECKPNVVFGEQVASRASLAWFDLVSADLEAAGYAIGAVDLCAAGVGAPHKRQRLWFVAQPDGYKRKCDARRDGPGATNSGGTYCKPIGSSVSGIVVNSISPERKGNMLHSIQREWQGRGENECPARPSPACGMAHSAGSGAGYQCRATTDEGWKAVPSGTTGIRQDDGTTSTAGSQPGSPTCGMADTESARGWQQFRGCDGEAEAFGCQINNGWASSWADKSSDHGSSGVANAERDGGRADEQGRRQEGRVADGGNPWACDWLPCRDGKARPVEPVLITLDDGLPESLGRVCEASIQELEKEITHYADASQEDARKAVHDLWSALSEEAICRGQTRRLDGIHEAPVLLAFLRQLSNQGWAFSESIPRTSPQAEEATSRGLRREEPTTCSPYQRGLDRQSPQEYPDLVHILSSVLARHAQASWGEAFDTNARATFPLSRGEVNRVGRLRGYGNAIVPQVAAEVIKTYLEIANDTTCVSSSDVHDANR